jgi:hypothetical protein
LEIKVNREIRDYNEALLLGLSLRQIIFSVLAIGVAIGMYFLLRNTFSIETLSWLCILCAVPFAALGFVKYNGMTAEKLLLCILRTVVMPKVLLYKSDNLYESTTQEATDY